MLFQYNVGYYPPVCRCFCLLGGGGVCEADGGGITKNPEGSLPLPREVSPQVTEGEKSYPVKFSR